MVSNNTSTCQDCGGKLKYYDKVRRIVRTKGRVSKWVNVPRYQCSECGCIRRYLPDYIYPYKQYESEIITYKFVVVPATAKFKNWRENRKTVVTQPKDDIVDGEFMDLDEETEEDSE